MDKAIILNYLNDNLFALQRSAFCAIAHIAKFSNGFILFQWNIYLTLKLTNNPAFQLGDQ